jgi:hypothetical protein
MLRCEQRIQDLRAHQAADLILELQETPELLLLVNICRVLLLDNMYETEI